MCLNRKQILNITASLAVLLITNGVQAASRGENHGDKASVGQLVIGEGADGITDRAYVIAPPNWYYVVDIEPGSFLNCGDFTQARKTDDDGRDQASLNCGVTLTETVVIPAASTSATITIHY